MAFKRMKSAGARIYDAVVRNPGRVFIVAAGIAGAVLLSYGIKNKGEEVYRGTIDKKEVVYEEGRFSFKNSSSFSENRMRVRDNGNCLDFVDCASETDIDWQNAKKPCFEDDKLEVIVSGERRFYSSDIDDKTLKGQETKKVFELGNKLYNELRERIREDLRVNECKDYEKAVGALEKLGANAEKKK